MGKLQCRSCDSKRSLRRDSEKTTEECTGEKNLEGIHTSEAYFFVWRAMHGRVPVEEVLHARGVTTVSCYVLYEVPSALEDAEHLFLECGFAKNIWSLLSFLLNRNFSFTSVHGLIRSSMAAKDQVGELCFATTCFALWQIWTA